MSPPLPPSLPWSTPVPLMLAPMQGLTNRALRAWFVARVRPDTVFTEFMRVGGSGKGLAQSDRREIGPDQDGVPLVVQLIGHDIAGMVAAARTAEAAGARHLNLNLGCPFGRMGSGPTGGALLREPQRLHELVPALRTAIAGTFSVKVRAGYAAHDEIFALLPLFEQCGVDFLILHPRTVLQGYGGRADHNITSDVVHRTSLPVIANGDIRSAADGQRILTECGAAGLMLGRGALADPFLFERLRGRAPKEPTPSEHLDGLRLFLAELTELYRPLFCGEKQVLGKLKDVLANLDHPLDATFGKRLKKARTLANFKDELNAGI